MSIRLYDGTTWNNQKGLQLYNGSAWAKSKSGWIYDGTSWSMFYPEFPLNSVLPSISGSATQGSNLTVGFGTWSSLDAYTNSGVLVYSYQWKSAGVNVGTNSNQYQTQLSDVGKSITCVVTASNFRGSTSATSSNSVTVQSAIPSPPTGVTVSDTTATPGAPSGVVVTPLSQPSGQTDANVSWNASTGTFNFYEGVSSIGVLYNVNSSTRTASITSGTPSSSVTASIRAGNTNGVASISWTASANTTSYDVYLYNITDGTSSGPFNTSLTNYVANVVAGKTYQAQVYSKNAAGSSSTTGNSANTSINIKYSSYAQGSSTFLPRTIPTISGLTASSITSSSATLSWSSTNQTEYQISGYTGWLSGSNTSYNLTGLSASTGYTVTVFVRSSTLNTASASTSFSTTVTPVIPTFTSAATVTGISSTGGTLSWGSTNQNSYSISTSPSTALNGATGFTATSRLFTGLTAGTTYSYTVTITSSTGHTAQSSGNFTTTGGVSAPGVPGSVNTSSSGLVTWTAPTSGGAVTSYTVEYQLASNSAGSLTLSPATQDVTGTSYQITYQTVGGQLYNFARARVKANNSGGSSAYSGFSPTSGYI